MRTLPKQATHAKRTVSKIVGTKHESSISTFIFQRDEKSHKEVFMLICLLSKQIFSNLLKIRRSSFSKECLLPCEMHAQKRAKTTPQDMVVQPVVDEEAESSPNGSDSEASSSSQTTSTVNAEDVDSDLEELANHYYSPLRRYSTTLERGRPRCYTTQELFAQEWDFQGGRDGLERFLSLPATWPLARLMFPIRNLKKQMETLLQTYCFETAVTCAEVEEQSSFIKRMALHLGQYMAIYLAETITGLLQRVLTHPAKGLVNETNAALLTQKFWAQAIYCVLPVGSER